MKEITLAKTNNQMPSGDVSDKNIVLPDSFDHPNYDPIELISKIDNLKVDTYRICQNWLTARTAELACDHDYARHKEILILLGDINRLIDKIKTLIKIQQLEKIKIHHQVENIVSKCLGVAPEDVLFTSNLVELCIDSLGKTELFLALEAALSIELSNKIASKISTVKQLINYLIVAIKEQKSAIAYCSN